MLKSGFPEKLEGQKSKEPLGWRMTWVILCQHKETLPACRCQGVNKITRYSSRSEYNKESQQWKNKPEVGNTACVQAVTLRCLSMAEKGIQRPEPDHMCPSRIQRTEGSANWQEQGDHLASFTQVAEEMNNWRTVGKLSSEGGPLLCP